MNVTFFFKSIYVKQNSDDSEGEKSEKRKKEERERRKEGKKEKEIQEEKKEGKQRRKGTVVRLFIGTQRIR